MLQSYIKLTVRHSLNSGSLSPSEAYETPARMTRRMAAVKRHVDVVMLWLTGSSKMFSPNIASDDPHRSRPCSDVGFSSLPDTTLCDRPNWGIRMRLVSAHPNPPALHLLVSQGNMIETSDIPCVWRSV